MYARILRIIVVVGAIAFISFGPREAHGINIILESFTDSTHPRIVAGTATVNGIALMEQPPSFDLDSSALLNVLQEVETEFQDVFEDSSTIRITYLWDPNTTDSSGNSLAGQSPPNLIVEDANGNITHAVVRFRPDIYNWYIDPTPASDSEYAMDQMLYNFGDAPGVDRLANFEQTDLFQVLAPGDEVPAVFEAGYLGSAVPGGPADANASGTQWDLLTIAFQEVGHSLGMSSGYSGNLTYDSDNNPNGGNAFDGFWEFDPDWVDNQQIATKISGIGSNGPFAHFNSDDAVMGSLNSGERTRPSAADFMTIAAIRGWTTLDLPRQDFLSGNNWTVPGSWMGNQVPDSSDDAYIRHGGLVTLSEDALISNLVIDGGSLLAISNVSTLGVFNATTVGGTVGDTSQITINANSQLDSDILNIDFDGRVLLDDDTSLLQSERIVVKSGGALEGRGTIDLNDNLFGRLTLDGGTIRVTGGELQIQSANALALDLQSGGVEVIDGDLRLSTGMFSPIGADITVGAGREVIFEAASSIGDGGLLNLVGQAGSPAVSTGMSLFVSDGGAVNANGLGIVENPLVLLPSGFVTTQIFDPDSEIRLNGATFYQGGGVLGPGFARQNGDAFFNEDTEISINTYDMDGQPGTTTLTIDPGVTVTINSPKIEVAADNAFDGTLIINGGTLHMEHDWRLDGVLNLNQVGGTAELVGPGRVTVATDGVINVAGAGRIDSPITLQGSLSVGSVADLHGDTIITATAELETNNPNDAINLYGATVIGGGSYTGGGLLRFQGTVQVIGNTAIGMSQSDLDGTTLGGALNIAPGITLSVASTTLDPADDDYDDTMNLRGTFSTLVPFVLDGTVNMIQEQEHAAPRINGPTGFTILTGGEVNTNGDAQINRNTTVQGGLHVGQGTTQINAASIVFESTADVTVADGGTLALNGPITYEGGSHTGLGLIQFNGTTNIDDDTTIGAARVDLDGAAENTVLNLNDSQLTLNVGLVDATSIQFNGLANVVGENAELAVNLNGPSSAWRLMPGGQLNFSNPSPAAPTVVMLSGSPLSAEGVINAVGRLILGADVEVKYRLNAQTAQTNVHFGGPMRSTIHANPTATVVGLGQVTVDEDTTLNLEDQSLVAVDATNRGRLEIGFEAAEASIDYTVPATATIRGFFAQTLGGELAVDLGGTVQANEYDWLQVIGRARLSGTVEATFIDDFVPARGTIFTILTATNGIEGMFDTVAAIDENGVLGYVLTDLYTATEAMLRVDDIFLIGDYNDDGAVDAADYTVWRDHLGAPAGTLPNDIHDTPIGALQYDTWKAHFGNTFSKAGAAQASAVPEPASSLLLLLVAMGIAVSHRKFVRRPGATW